MGKKDESEILRVEESPNGVEPVLQALHYEQLCHRIQVARSAQRALDFLFRRDAYREHDPHNDKEANCCTLQPKAFGETTSGRAA